MNKKRNDIKGQVKNIVNHDLSWQCKHGLEGRHCPLCVNWQPINIEAKKTTLDDHENELQKT